MDDRYAQVLFIITQSVLSSASPNLKVLREEINIRKTLRKFFSSPRRTEIWRIFTAFSALANRNTFVQPAKKPGAARM
jgi:hypothetical protein